MAQRPRHPDKELESLLAEAEGRRWRVTKGKKYFKMWCPCPLKCKKTVRLTPSGVNYEKNLRMHLARSTCWEG